MKYDRLIPWKAVAICDMLKIFWKVGARTNERRFGEPIEGPVVPLIIIRFLPKTNQDFINLVLGISRGYALFGSENSKGFLFGRRLGLDSSSSREKRQERLDLRMESSHAL